MNIRHMCLRVVLSALFLVSPVLISPGLTSPVLAGPSPEKDILCKEKIGVMIQDYEMQVSTTQKALDDLRADLKWTQLKIIEMKNMGQAVPPAFDQSVAYRVHRISVLEKQKTEYEKVLENLKLMRGSQKSGFTLAELEAGIQTAKLDNWLRIAVDDETGQVVAKTALPILFPSGSATVASSYSPFLKNLAGLIKDHRVQVRVNGYTDPDRIKSKKFPSNFELGAARAANVVHALVKQGVNPSVFRIESPGEFRIGRLQEPSQKAFERYVDLEILFL